LVLSALMVMPVSKSIKCADHDRKSLVLPL
jgi:hypothetical protein